MVLAFTIMIPGFIQFLTVIYISLLYYNNKKNIIFYFTSGCQSRSTFVVVTVDLKRNANIFPLTIFLKIEHCSLQKTSQNTKSFPGKKIPRSVENRSTSLVKCQYRWMHFTYRKEEFWRMHFIWSLRSIKRFWPELQYVKYKLSI